MVDGIVDQAVWQEAGLKQKTHKGLVLTENPMWVLNQKFNMAKVKHYLESELIFSDKPSVQNFKDLEGGKFGKLTVLGFSGGSGKRSVRKWNCKCECGNFVVVDGWNLRSGQTKSCGCRRGTHGMSNSRTYKIWVGMLERCFNPKRKEYLSYGGRGISVHESWLSFEGFFDDMGVCPEGLSLDRLDNNKGYEPGNCAWRTRKEQQRNMRSNVYLTYDGKTMTIVEWSEVLGIDQKAIESRLRRGWTVEQALSIPPGTVKRIKRYEGLVRG